MAIIRPNSICKTHLHTFLLSCDVGGELLIRLRNLCQPSRGWLAVVERGKITQSFRRERVCKFAGKKRRFYNSGKTGNL